MALSGSHITDPVLASFAVDHRGQCHAVPSQDVPAELKNDGFCCVLLDAMHDSARDWLQAHVTYLDPLLLEALLVEETRARYLEYEQGMMVILRGVNPNPQEGPDDMVSVRLWVDATRVIMLQRRPLAAIERLMGDFKSGFGPKSSGECLATLSHYIFDAVDDLVSDLTDRMDALEDDVEDTADPQLRSKAAELRRMSMTIRRFMTPQREVLMAVRSSALPILGVLQRRRIQETLDRVLRYIDDLEAVRDRAQMVKEELTTLLTERINRSIFLLSLVASIFLPLTFLTGLLGANVGGIPGTDNPNAFWFMCAASGVLILVQLILFRMQKWV